MIDFHSHVLPVMDDGSDSIMKSLEMLRESYQQGVDAIVATSHYYADEEYPRDFLNRRKKSFDALQEAIASSSEVFPRVIPGAEVLYFPGLSDAEDIANLKIAGSNTILIEPPMTHWRDAMLDDIASLQLTHHCLPVIAHVDRFMKYLGDESLIDRVLGRGMLVQVNADYFLNPRTQRAAFQNLRNGKIHLIGSDCHNLSDRAPNLGAAWRAANAFRLSREFGQLEQNAVRLLGLRGNQL